MISNAFYNAYFTALIECWLYQLTPSINVQVEDIVSLDVEKVENSEGFWLHIVNWPIEWGEVHPSLEELRVMDKTVVEARHKRDVLRGCYTEGLKYISRSESLIIAAFPHEMIEGTEYNIEGLLRVWSNGAFLHVSGRSAYNFYLVEAVALWLENIEIIVSPRIIMSTLYISYTEEADGLWLVISGWPEDWGVEPSRNELLSLDREELESNIFKYNILKSLPKVPVLSVDDYSKLVAKPQDIPIGSLCFYNQAIKVWDGLDFI